MNSEKLFCVVVDADEDNGVQMSVTPATSAQILRHALGLAHEDMITLVKQIVEQSRYSDPLRQAIRRAGLIFSEESIDKKKIVVEDIILQEGPYTYTRINLGKLTDYQLEKMADGAGLYCKLSPKILPDGMREEYLEALKKVRVVKKKRQERNRQVSAKRRQKKVDEAKKLLQKEGLI